jgi:alpha-L-fucosidase 2
MKKLCAAMAVLLAVKANAGDLRLWYDQPGTNNLAQGLLLGNGRMGAIVLGNPTNDSIVLNENSLWTGSTNSAGSYQVFGNLVLSLPSHTNAASYYRELNVSNAVARVTYKANGVNYTREMFCSYPDQVMVIQLTADTANAYAGKLQYQDGHSVASASVTGGITAAGTLGNGEQYAARILAQNSGGTLTSSGGVIAFTNCTSLTVFVALATDYVMDYSKSYHSGVAPATTVAAQISAASAKTYVALETAHTNDFESFFSRVGINLGAEPSSRTNLPTDQRLVADTAANDPDLEALMFQYGRYLLLASSRTNGCPANLQGLWNDNNSPAWNSDYHTDINLEMNYWSAEVANLSECAIPLFNYMQSQVVPWTWTTTNTYGTPGWTVQTSLNLNGGMSWNWENPANAWLCRYLWEHYAFTGDTNFLANVAYPLMKGACQFHQARLKAMPDGTLVSPQGWSPEHGPAAEDGVTYDQTLIWDLFSNYIQASTILGVDADYRATIAGLQATLLTPRIGPWGELREWLYTPDDPTDNHRHTSHLIGVFSGQQITPDQTPELANAAAVSLVARGTVGDSGVTEWCFVNRTAIWARLLNAAKAHQELAMLFNSNGGSTWLFPNLIPNLGGTAQWDGAFAMPGSIAEMLLQSHEGKIVLLPALPTAWPYGSVTGLRARGGFTVDMAWTNGVLISATIHSLNGTNCLVQYGSQTNQLTIPLGGATPFTLSAGGGLSDSGLANRTLGGAGTASGGTAANAFDGAATTSWLSGSPAQTAWLQYQFAGGAAWAVTQYKLISSGFGAASDPANWQLLGSNGGSTWSVLDTQTNQTFSGRMMANRYAVANAVPYRFYQLNITTTAGGNGSSVALAEFQLWSPDTVATASASSDYPAGGQAAAQAFDSNIATKWYNTGIAPPGWLQYQFGGGAGWVVTNYNLTSANDVPQRDPANWLFQGSNDGLNWMTLDTETNQSFPNRYQTRSYTNAVANTTPYCYYQLYISANAGGSSYGLQLSEFNLPKVGGQPEPPGFVSALAGAGQVALVWNSAVGATAYNLKQSTNYGGPFTTVASGIAATNYTAGGLVNGVTNWFVVSAVSNSVESVNSTQISAVPNAPPAAPTGLSGTALNSMAALQWNAVPGAGTYNVKYSVTNGGSYAIYGTAVGTPNYSVFGLTNGQPYYFVISAIVNGVESTNSAQLTVVPVGPPTGLNATGSNAAVVLKWNLFSGATAYNVKRSVASGGPYTLIASVTTTNFTDTNVVNGTPYFYIVTMIYAGNESGNSSEVNAIPAPHNGKLTGSIIGTPGSYNNLGNNITNVFDGNLTTYFDGPNSSNGNGCWAGLDFGSGVSNVITQIQYCPRTGNESRMVGGLFQGANDPSFTNPVTLFTVLNTPPDAVMTVQSVGNVTAFRYARYLSPNGGWGNVSEVEFDGYPAANFAPLPPTGLTAVAGAGLVMLAWNASANAIGYNLRRSTTSGGGYTLVAGNWSGLAYTNSGLVNGVTYYFVVSATNAVGDGANSLEAAAQPVALTSPPVSCSLSGGQIQINWPADHLGWLLQAQTNPPSIGLGTNWLTIPGSGGTNQATIPIGPTNGSVFYRLISP